MLQLEEVINKNYVEAQNLEKLEESKPKPEKKEEQPEKKEVRIPGPTLNPSLCTSPKTMAFFHINKVKVNPNNETQKKLMEKEKEENINNTGTISVNVEKYKKKEIKQEKNKKIISLLSSSIPLEEDNLNDKNNNSNINGMNTNIEYTDMDMNNDIDMYEPYPGYDFDYDYDYNSKKEEKKLLEKKTKRDKNEIKDIPSYITYQSSSYYKDKIDSGTQTVKNVEMINRSTSCERTNVNPTKVKILNLIDEYSYQEVFDALMKYYFPNYNCEYSQEVIGKISNLVNDISLDQIVSYIISIGNSRQEVIKVNINSNKEKELSSQEEEIDYEDNDNNEENDMVEIS